jgi:hypothetical protein
MKGRLMARGVPSEEHPNLERDRAAGLLDTEPHRGRVRPRRPAGCGATSSGPLPSRQGRHAQAVADFALEQPAVWARSLRRAMHAFSPGHGIPIPPMARVRAGAEVLSFSPACLCGTTVSWHSQPCSQGNDEDQPRQERACQCRFAFSPLRSRPWMPGLPSRTSR